MMRFLLVLVFLYFLSVPAFGTLLIQQEDTWEYCELDFELRKQLTSIEYSDFDWENAGWIEGKAAFGSGREPLGGTINAVWKVGTDIALRKTFEIESVPTENLHLDLAIDNGCVIFINGNEVAEFIGEMFTRLWEYSIKISPEYLQPGINTVSVLAEDHGGATYFDMQLHVVPEPATVCLLGLGSLMILKRRR